MNKCICNSIYFFNTPQRSDCYLGHIAVASGERIGFFTHIVESGNKCDAESFRNNRIHVCNTTRARTCQIVSLLNPMVSSFVGTQLPRIVCTCVCVCVRNPIWLRIMQQTGLHYCSCPCVLLRGTEPLRVHRSRCTNVQCVCGAHVCAPVSYPLRQSARRPFWSSWHAVQRVKMLLLPSCVSAESDTTRALN